MLIGFSKVYNPLEYLLWSRPVCIIGDTVRTFADCLTIMTTAVVAIHTTIISEGPLERSMEIMAAATTHILSRVRRAPQGEREW